MALVIASAFLRKFEDGIILFYDSEFGASKKYFESAGIDPNRVFHTPVTDIEQLKHDTMSQLNELKRGDHVLILVDSIGNLASAKETQDAIDGKSVADMTRAKALKSYFRMVTPHLTLKSIPMIAINHTYKEQSLFPKDIVSGGCVTPGTMVKMADGTEKPIESIDVGELVMTHLGAREVTHTWNPETLVDGTPNVYRVTFDDGSIIECSESHRFLTETGWKYVTEVTENDLLVKVDSDASHGNVTKVEAIGKTEVYDLSVAEAESYVTANGIVNHNTGGIYSSNNIWIISRSQEKVDDSIGGRTFNINIEKSRRVKERSRIPVTVMYDGGIQKTSGLQEWATELGFMVSPSKGWYSYVDPETGEVDEKKYRAKELNYEWFKPILENPLFQQKVKEKFALPTTNLISDAGEFEGIENDDEAI